MCKEEITFDKLPQAVAYLIEQVETLCSLVQTQKPTPEKRLPIEIDEACSLIHKAKPTVYALARKGEIPCYKHGKKLYFYEDELMAWIAQGRRKSAHELRAEIEAEMSGLSRRKPRTIKF